MLAPRRVTTAEGLSLEYAEAGAGKAVLLLHGNFATWRWWNGLLQRPFDGVRFIAPTMRGCAGTRGGGRASVYELPALARDVIGVADALGVGRFHLVGHSLGGAIALQCALDFPARVTGLDLVASAPGDALESMLAREHDDAQLLRRFNPERALDRAALMTVLRLGRDLGTNRRWLGRLFTTLMPQADLETVGFERLVADAAAMEPIAIVNLFRALARWDVRSRRAELKVPTRVLAGRRDTLVPLAALEKLARDVKGATVTIFDCGHAPMMEAPDAFAGWLAEGLRATGTATRLVAGSLTSARGVLATAAADNRLAQPAPEGRWSRLVRWLSGLLGRLVGAR